MPPPTAIDPASELSGRLLNTLLDPTEPNLPAACLRLGLTARDVAAWSELPEIRSAIAALTRLFALRGQVLANEHLTTAVAVLDQIAQHGWSLDDEASPAARVRKLEVCRKAASAILRFAKAPPGLFPDDDPSPPKRTGQRRPVPVNPPEEETDRQHPSAARCEQQPRHSPERFDCDHPSHEHQQERQDGVPRAQRDMCWRKAGWAEAGEVPRPSGAEDHAESGLPRVPLAAVGGSLHPWLQPSAP